jgi:hypothetical protein
VSQLYPTHHVGRARRVANESVQIRSPYPVYQLFISTTVSVWFSRREKSFRSCGKRPDAPVEHRIEETENPCVECSIHSLPTRKPNRQRDFFDHASHVEAE